MGKPTAYGLLREDLTPETPRRKERVKKWFDEFEATNYPNRPLTKQYFELQAVAKEIKLL